MNDFGAGWGADANYIVARLIALAHPQRYIHWQEVVGSLECCKLEVYRVAIGPYEQVKRAENGPVL
jgi:hypothetical protein